MRLTITTLQDQICPLEVSDDLEIENLKAMCEFEVGIPAAEMVVVWNGRPLQQDKRTLKDYGIKDGEMILIQHMRSQPQAPPPSSQGGMPMIDFSQIEIPGGRMAQPRPGPSTAPPLRAPDDPETIRQILLSNPHELSLLKERNPQLAEALLSNSSEKFKTVFEAQQKERQEKEREKIRLLNSDPFDPRVQEMIAEEIRMKNVETNMETAIEYSPESFGQVVMLYINCTVNGHAVKAFVDSGAQMTIMSQACAERCGIMRLVDQRWAGIAKGVGTQKIIGRVHLGQIQIGKDFLQSSFSILEDQPMDMLLGLDMLKRHQCSLDLKNNKLVIGTTGTETSFLPESELPEHARLNINAPLSPRAAQEEDDKQLAAAINKSSQEAGARVSGSTNVKPLFPEETIQKLMSSGFSRENVIAELKNCSGDVDKALASLFAKHSGS